LSATDLDEPSVATSGTKVEEADIAAAETLGRHRNEPAVRAVGAFSELADQAPASALCGAVIAAGLISGRPKLAEAGIRMLGSVLVATAIKSVIKGLVSRARPHVLIEEGDYAFEPGGGGDGDWHSFPSGHTADAVAAAQGLVRIFPAASGPAYAVAAVIGAVQIPRAKHYPIDVAAGVAVGIVAEMAVNVAAAAVHRALQSEARG
jgi:membrane-associated phospholipid phosphatase